MSHRPIAFSGPDPLEPPGGTTPHVPCRKESRGQSKKREREPERSSLARCPRVFAQLVSSSQPNLDPPAPEVLEEDVREEVRDNRDGLGVGGHVHPASPLSVHSVGPVDVFEN